MVDGTVVLHGGSQRTSEPVEEDRGYDERRQLCWRGWVSACSPGRIEVVDGALLAMDGNRSRTVGKDRPRTILEPVMINATQGGENRRTLPGAIRAPAGYSQSTGPVVSDPGMVAAGNRSLRLPAQTRSD